MDYQELFNHMHNEHDVILLESEMQEIVNIVNKMQDDEETKLILEIEHNCEYYKEPDGVLLFCSVFGKQI